MFAVVRSKAAETSANYLVVDAPAGVAKVTVDGRSTFNLNHRKKNKVTGAEHYPFIAELAPGHHLIEVLDDHEKVLEHLELDVPNSRYHAILSVGKPRRYTFVSVAYGGSKLDLPETVDLLPGPVANVSVMPDVGDTQVRDLEVVSRTFPAEVYSKDSHNVFRSFCPIDDDASDTGTFEGR